MGGGKSSKKTTQTTITEQVGVSDQGVGVLGSGNVIIQENADAEIIQSVLEHASSVQEAAAELTAKGFDVAGFLAERGIDISQLTLETAKELVFGSNQVASQAIEALSTATESGARLGEKAIEASVESSQLVGDVAAQGLRLGEHAIDVSSRNVETALQTLSEAAGSGSELAEQALITGERLSEKTLEKSGELLETGLSFGQDILGRSIDLVSGVSESQSNLAQNIAAQSFELQRDIVQNALDTVSRSQALTEVTASNQARLAEKAIEDIAKLTGQRLETEKQTSETPTQTEFKTIVWVVAGFLAFALIIFLKR